MSLLFMKIIFKLNFAFTVTFLLFVENPFQQWAWNSTVASIVLLKSPMTEQKECQTMTGKNCKSSFSLWSHWFKGTTATLRLTDFSNTDLYAQHCRTDGNRICLAVI